MFYDVIVVGGGPSGLVAGATAARLGASVLLLERMPEVGTKLRITGKGRCNITNARPVAEYRSMLHGNVDLAMEALERFSNQDIITLLHQEGVATVVERGERVYPVSGRAADVAKALNRYAIRNGVEIRFRSEVERIEKEGDSWSVYAGGRYDAESVILACGGKSYPTTGSDGAGYRLAERLGHSTSELFPSLVGFFVNTDWGVRERFLVKNVGLTLYCAGKETLVQTPVDIELCDDWVGGPGVLRLSRRAVEALRKEEAPEMVIDFKPALSLEKLIARFKRDILARAHEPLLSLARAWMPAELLRLILRRARLSPQIKAHILKENELTALAQTLKAFRVQLCVAEGWERAVVTAGGIASQEVDPKTLGSRLQQGLFFCGEMLDIDGNTGGFNLQLAYSTGFVAGKAAVEYCNNSIRKCPTSN